MTGPRATTVNIGLTVPDNLYDPYIDPIEFCFDFRSSFVLILRYFRGLIVCVLSNVAIISLGKRELTALLYLSFYAMWLLLFFTSSSRCRGLMRMIAAFPGHFHLPLE